MDALMMDGLGAAAEGGLYSWAGAGGHDGDGEVCRVRGRQGGDPCRVGRYLVGSAGCVLYYSTLY